MFAMSHEVSIVYLNELGSIVSSSKLIGLRVLNISSACILENIDAGLQILLKGTNVFYEHTLAGTVFIFDSRYLSRG